MLQKILNVFNELLKIYFSKCVAPQKKYARTFEMNVGIHSSFLPAKSVLPVVDHLLISERCRVLTQKSQSYNPSLAHPSVKVAVVGKCDEFIALLQSVAFLCVKKINVSL
jgi:hypothetical protein